MNIRWEEEMRKNLVEEIEAVDFPAEDRMLEDIHRQMKKRRVVMKMNRKHTGIVLAAALIAIGAVTAIGAGKIAYYSSGHSPSDEVADIDGLREQAKQELGGEVNCPENLADGIRFSRGIVIQVEARDEESNMVGTFPEMKAFYQDGAGRGYGLSVSRPIQQETYGEEKKMADYQEISIYGSADQYLFLPPEETPSAEDKQLEEEGKLFISYGSSEVERKTFTYAVWDMGEFHYLLSTYEDVSRDELLEWAKKIIDAEVK